MRSKRGQAQRVFLYIMTIVIIGMIVLFGYKAIAGLLEVGDTASKVKFQKDFQNSIAQGRSYGRISMKTFAVGDNYKEVCMIDQDAIDGDLSLTQSNVKNPLIVDSVTSKAPENAFLVLDDGGLEPYEVEPLEVANGGICFPVQSGKVHMRLEGLGNRVKISDVPAQS